MVVYRILYTLGTYICTHRVIFDMLSKREGFVILVTYVIIRSANFTGTQISYKNMFFVLSLFFFAYLLDIPTLIGAGVRYRPNTTSPSVLFHPCRKKIHSSLYAVINVASCIQFHNIGRFASLHYLKLQQSFIQSTQTRLFDQVLQPVY